MKSKNIVSMFLFVCNAGFSQSNTVYYCDILHRTIPPLIQTAYISFYPGNLYVIILESRTEGGMDDLWTVGPVVSHGTYRHIGDKKIILTDSENACRMSLRKINDHILYFERSFGWLSHKEFILSSMRTDNLKEDCSALADYYRDGMISDQYGVSSMNKRRNAYVLQIPETYPLLFGEYEGDGFVGVSLWIHPNKTYRMMFKGEYNFCFSEGSWSREGNVLILHDTSLRQSFYVLVGDGKIQCVPFPFCYNTIFGYSGSIEQAM